MNSTTLQSLYALVLILSIITITLSLLLRVFSFYDEAAMGSKMSLLLALVALILSFAIDVTSDLYAKIFICSILSIMFLILIYAKNRQKHIKDFDTILNKLVIIILTMLYVGVVSVLMAMLKG